MFNRFEQFTTAISQINKSVQRIKSTEGSAYGREGSHVRVLVNLKKRASGLAPSRLGENGGVDKAAISRALKELQGKGFVREAESGGRKYRIPLVLTESGNEAAEHIENAIKNAVEIGGAGLTDRQRGEFYHSLLLIAKNLEEYSCS